MIKSASCSCTHLPLILPGASLFSPPETCHSPSTSSAATPLPRVPTSPVQSLLRIPFRQSQVIVLFWSRIPGPRPARRSTHSRPRRACTLSPLPLLLETQVPFPTMVLLCHFWERQEWLGGLGNPHSMPRVSGGPRLPI